MRAPAPGPGQQVVDYYRRLESRWSYALLLGGTRHFGYYPPGGGHVRVRTALRLMEDRLGQALGLPAGALVLDAGCGQGSVALRLAATRGLRVEGVDLVAGDVRRANARAARLPAGDRPRFQVMDYARLDFPDAHFDGVYTMETLVHAPDSRAVLDELRRVLKPGGRLVLFEYSVPARPDMTDRQRRVLDAVVEESAMHGLPGFVHGGFPALVATAGFEDVAVEDITERMLPMVRWLARVLWLPYQAARLLGWQRRVVNAMAAVESTRYAGMWRYNVVTAAKPTA